MASGFRCAARTGFVVAIAMVVACSGSTATIGGSGDGGDGGDSSSAGGSSGGSGGASSSGGDVTIDQACADLASSLCHKIQTCAPFLVVYTWGDEATCVAREKLGCPAFFNAPGTGITVNKAEACAPAFMNATCEDMLANKTPSACAFHGSVPDGGSCVEDSQCSEMAYCDLSRGQGCGVCSARATMGGTCTADGNCQRGLVCAKANNAATGLCAEPVGQGGSCDSTHPCLANLGCTSAGVCAASLGAGAPCSIQTCDSLHGLYCNPATHICAQIQTATAGNPCGYSAANASYAVCLASGRCVLAMGSNGGTCEATAGDGQGCDATRGPPCLPPAYCAAGTCTLPSANCH